MADKTLKINGRDYAQADFNDTARTLLRNIAITDDKIRSLQQEVTLFKVAREAFGTALLAHLPEAVETTTPAPAKTNGRAQGSKAEK